MAKRWTLTTQFSFDAAHKIDGHRGKCGNLHGHTYTVMITAVATELRGSEYCDRPNMVADYATLKSSKKLLDHACLNDVMETGDTTAEVIAKWIYNYTKEQLHNEINLTVAVSETPGNWAEFADS